FQAMRDTRTAFYLYLFENGCNIAVAIAFFVADRNFGVRGLALSLSIAYTAAAVVAFVVLRIRVGGVDGRATLRSLSRVLTLSAFMAIVAAILDTVVGADHGAGLVLRVVAAVAGGALAYFGAAGVLARASSAWQTARRRQSRSYYRPLRPR
ncbi:MAG TPA: lipid II flippase MurJ, partial [Acidimicrobiales bacterium]|nr:lipid II flippase MurJ [Acidimicrobiales bacterium]